MVCGGAGSVPPLVVVLVIDGHAVRVAALVVGMTGVPVGEVGLHYIQSTCSSTNNSCTTVNIVNDFQLYLCNNLDNTAKVIRHGMNK